MATLQGVVSDITYRNEDNGFSVVRVRSETEILPVVSVGTMPALERGESVVLEGAWANHPRFGRQFTVESYTISRPTTEEGILALLSSGLINNIGETRARRIVARFGVETLDVLDNQPQRLRDVEGIGPKLLKKIRGAWEQQKTIRDLMMFLQDFGVSVNLATKIHKAYGASARQVLSQNPYELINDIWGVGFKKADAIAQKMGYEHDSFRRVKSGLAFVLREAMTDGNLFLPRTALVDKAVDLLGVDQEKTIYSLDHLVQAQEVVQDGDAIYLPAALSAETATASLLCKLVAQQDPGNGQALDTAVPDAWLSSYAQRTGWKGDPKQIEAVRSALQSSVFLLTGGPGTGKTTTLQVIVSFLRERHVAVSLAAPTGRAAQRMGSIAGLKAQTIHRLLEFKPAKDGFFFARNTRNPLQAGVVIIDEVSMIDVFLMRALLRAVSPPTRIVFVGDDNQLPSVGPGNVLSDMIASRKIPHVELTTVFRQAAQSTIVRAAHEIMHGQVPEFTNSTSDTCFFVSENDPEHCLSTISDMVSARLPRKYGFNPMTDIQVLSPMHKGPLGTQAINRQLQQVLNSSPRKLARGETSFTEGDRVMQVRNNYDTGVFNGDIGHIVAIHDENSLTVDFGGQSVAYDARNLEELTLAYCISIHKSQGCEFRAVVIPLMTQHFIMLQRNLIYTALTRARELCVFVGMPNALSIGVRNNDSYFRHTNLARRIVSERDVGAAAAVEGMGLRS